LSLTTERLKTRLRDLEQTVTAMEGANRELRESVQALETGTAGYQAATREGMTAAVSGGTDGGLAHSVDRLNERTQVLEEHLQRLSAAQEGLELQIALLSREAEEGDGLLGGGDTGAVASGNPPHGTDTIAEQVPGLLTRLDTTEETARVLGSRAGELEAEQQALVEQDKRFSDELRTLEQRLSELDAKIEKVADSGAAPAIDEQIALLRNDLSRNQSRIEEVRGQDDELEGIKLNFTRHTDALADRIAGINQQLQDLLALEPKRRLDELEHMGGALERSLHEEQQRLDALESSEQAIDQRLLSAIDDATALDERVRGLAGSGEQLGGEIDRLEVALRAAEEGNQQHRDRLQAHELRLEEQRQRLEDAVEETLRVNEGLGARLSTLDESRQNLQESADNLRVQQVRQDQDTQSLRKSLQRRTLIGLLLAAGVLVFMLTRGPQIPDDLQAVLQAATVADRESAAAIADLESDIGALRHEVVALGQSLADLARTVEVIETAGSPELARQLGGLAETVEELGQKNRAMEQRGNTLLSHQDEQRQLTVELQRIQDQQREESAELKVEQAQLAAELEEISGIVKGLSVEAGSRASAVSSRRSSIPVGPFARESAWSQAQGFRRYTLQLGGFHGQDSLERFLRSQQLGLGNAVYTTTYQDRPWHVVFHGIYTSVEQAVAAIGGLPKGLKMSGPWVRRIPKSGEIRPLQ